MRQPVFVHIRHRGVFCDVIFSGADATSSIFWNYKQKLLSVSEVEEQIITYSKDELKQRWTVQEKTRKFKVREKKKYVSKTIKKT